MILVIKNYIEIGTIKLYYYAFIIAFGALLALLSAIKCANRLQINKDDLIYAFGYGLILGIIGARLYYCIFAWDVYKDNPLLIITGIRNGGLAIHGGIIVAFLFSYFYCKKKKMPFISLVEVVAVGLLIGQMIGRWGNFFNQEAYGFFVPGDTVTEQRNWLLDLMIPRFIVDQMYIEELGGYCHPTFLYESLWNFIGLMIILILRRFSKKYWVGDAGLVYLIWYGIGRFFIESLRTDALFIGHTSIRIAQVSSIIMILLGIILFILRRVYKYKPIVYKNTINKEN